MKKIQLRRIIANGKFIPEIDGLRFIAIMSVLLYHIHTFLVGKNLNQYEVNQNNNYVPKFISNGSLGVELFFVISGFVLGLFFAKAYRNNKHVDHKSYFLRRLTRLEPPYIMSMVLLFFASVFVTNSLAFQEAIKSFFASIFYIHNIVYPGIYPKLMTVAWSLEVEVQFYILAPVLGLLFKIRSGVNRKILLIVLCIIFPFLSYLFPLPFISLYEYLAYFLLGFLITDIYLDQQELTTSNRFGVLASIIVLVLLIAFYQLDVIKHTLDYLYYSLIHLVLLFGVFYLVLIKRNVNFLKLNWVSNIGGACYSIYLLHFPIISIFGNQLVRFQITENKLIDNLIYGFLLLVIVLFLTGIFYIFIERPCMDKEWPKKLIGYFRKKKQ